MSNFFIIKFLISSSTHLSSTISIYNYSNMISMMINSSFIHVTYVFFLQIASTIWKICASIITENLNTKRNKKTRDESNLKTFRFSRCDHINRSFRRKSWVCNDLICKSKNFANQCMCRWQTWLKIWFFFLNFINFFVFVFSSKDFFSINHWKTFLLMLLHLQWKRNFFFSESIFIDIDISSSLLSKFFLIEKFLISSFVDVFPFWFSIMEFMTIDFKRSFLKFSKVDVESFAKNEMLSSFKIFKVV